MKVSRGQVQALSGWACTAPRLSTLGINTKHKPYYVNGGVLRSAMSNTKHKPYCVNGIGPGMQNCGGCSLV
jgi:hypothetical protein